MKFILLFIFIMSANSATAETPCERRAFTPTTSTETQPEKSLTARVKAFIQEVKEIGFEKTPGYANAESQVDNYFKYLDQIIGILSYPKFDQAFLYLPAEQMERIERYLNALDTVVQSDTRLASGLSLASDLREFIAARNLYGQSNIAPKKILSFSNHNLYFYFAENFSELNKMSVLKDWANTRLAKAYRGIQDDWTDGILDSYDLVQDPAGTARMQADTYLIYANGVTLGYAMVVKARLIDERGVYDAEEVHFYNRRIQEVSDHNSPPMADLNKID